MIGRKHLPFYSATLASGLSSWDCCKDGRPSQVLTAVALVLSVKLAKMYLSKPLLILLIVVSLGLSACQNTNEGDMASSTPVLEHPYISDSLIATPTIFFDGTVSTHIDKFNTSFSPDGNTIFYSAASQKFGLTSITYQTFDGGQFQEPEFVPFASHEHFAADVQISPDGTKMFFATNQNYEGKPEAYRQDFHIWVSENEGGVWQTPAPLDSTVNSGAGNKFYPVPTESGNLYFKSGDFLYYARFENGAYREGVRLPDNLDGVVDAYFARDESYMVGVIVDGEDGYGNSDLYISYNLGENTWSDPKNLGSEINSSGIDGSPSVTPDGKYLFFSSGRGRNVDALKEEAMKDYANLKSLFNSSHNSSLNFYYMSFDPEQFRG